MTRIPILGSEGLTPEQQKVYDSVVTGPRGAVVGPLRAALHSPELADRWQRLGEYLRYKTALPPRESELAIIIVARYWNSPVEWHIHAGVARRCDLDPKVIEAIRHAQAPVFADPLEAAIYDFTRELLEHGQVTDRVYAELYSRYDPVKMVELTALVGYYSMVAMTLNAHRVPLPPGPVHDLPNIEAADGSPLPATRLPPAKLATTVA